MASKIEKSLPLVIGVIGLGFVIKDYKFKKAIWSGQAKKKAALINSGLTEEEINSDPTLSLASLEIKEGELLSNNLKNNHTVNLLLYSTLISLGIYNMFNT